MSLLPQRKKTAEEIAKLRESLGVPGLSPETEPVPAAEVAAETAVAAPAEVDTIVPAHHQATLVHETTPEPEAAETLPPPHHEPGMVHSLKRSERIPLEPADEPAEIPQTTPPKDRPRKVVRSLRKSEQGPLPAASSTARPANSKLPAHRHNDQEINEFRRREALAMMNPPANPKWSVAHPALIIPGYILAIAGASCFVFYQFPMAATAACAATALIIAGYIFLRRPISRHHAAFIAVITLFVIVFGVLHYFPHLQHAT